MDGLSDIAVHITGITVPACGDIAVAAERVRARRAEATEAERKAREAAGDYARRLTKAGIPVRDIAELLGLSPQRVSQLTNA